MRRLLVICHLSLVVCLAAFAQSQVNYNLRVGTTGEVKVLQDFPETYAGEKVNVSIQHSAFTIVPADGLPYLVPINRYMSWASGVTVSIVIRMNRRSVGRSGGIIGKSRTAPSVSVRRTPTRLLRAMYAPILPLPNGVRDGYGWCLPACCWQPVSSMLSFSSCSVAKRRVSPLSSRRCYAASASAYVGISVRKPIYGY